MAQSFTLIGIDGGATKASGFVANINEAGDFSLTELHAEASYSDMEGFNPSFQPVPVTDQLEQRRDNNIRITPEEAKQGATYTAACAKIITELANAAGSSIPVLIGIGMPGLKTECGRGISAIANGPRMLNYAGDIEQALQKNGIELLAPIAHLGSDADYCGIGEEYAAEGSFRSVYDAYYLGGGTGTADALKLEGRLVPFDHVKDWIAKSWEMKNDKDLALERYASASGLQFLYAQKSKQTSATQGQLPNALKQP